MRRDIEWAKRIKASFLLRSETDEFVIGGLGSAGERTVLLQGGARQGEESLERRSHATHSSIHPEGAAQITVGVLTKPSSDLPVLYIAATNQS